MTESTTTPPKSELKKWLAIRTGISMSTGKLATQAGHAYQWQAIVAMRKQPDLTKRT